MVFLSQEDIFRLQNGCHYIDWSIITNESYEAFEKEHIYNEKLLKITETFKSAVTELKKWYSEDEIATWSWQYTEALRVKEWATKTMLEDITIAGETEMQLADKILANSEGYYPAFTKLLREKRQAESDLKKEMN